MTTQMRLERPRPVPGARGEQRPRVEVTHVVRFDSHQRLQHLLMMSSFIVLALTGLPQKFSDLGASQWWVATLGGLETVRLVHRVAGAVMLGDCGYHLCYLAHRIVVQRRFGAFRMIPTPKDLRDALDTVLYFLGMAPQKPRFGRFSYLEKFDYWAVFWGIAIIGTSGLILIFPVAATGILPGQAVAVALTVHGDEAILAAGWILIMHMFNVHLAPWSFPFNPAIFTGKISAKQCAEEHPLEWQRIEAARRAAAAESARRGAALRPPSPRPVPSSGSRSRAAQRRPARKKALR